jgi:glycosyltransferase involved in cell wall biosynthesis
MMIGVVTTSYPRFPDDPAGGFVGGHVAALRALGHEVDVIAAGDDRTIAMPGVARIGGGALFYRGGAPDRIEQAPLRSLAVGGAFAARLLAATAARAASWDAVIAHWLAPSAIAALPSTRPLTAIAHGGDIHTLRRLRLLAPVLHALHARRARLVFVSGELRSIARLAAPRLAAWLDGALVQPMGLDVARFAALARAPANPATVVVAARLVPIKGVDVAIDAMARVHAGSGAARGAHLVIAGDGPDRALLEARRPANATFLGEVDTRRRDELLRAASVVVIPSRPLANGRTEGMPTIALEALAAGVPVVASAVGGLRDLGHAVRLVPPDDPYELARAIDQTIAEPPSAFVLRSAVAHLDWNRVAERMLSSRV